VSLLALDPGQTIGPSAVAVAGAGLLFVTASLLSLIRLRQVHWRTTRDALFMVGLIITFVAELINGIQIIVHPDDSAAVNSIVVLVVICFLIGIAGHGSWSAGHRSVSVTRSRRWSGATSAAPTIRPTKSHHPSARLTAGLDSVSGHLPMTIAGTYGTCHAGAPVAASK